jgi:hypothetical protein
MKSSVFKTLYSVIVASLLRRLCSYLGTNSIIRCDYLERCFGDRLSPGTMKVLCLLSRGVLFTTAPLWP